MIRNFYSESLNEEFSFFSDEDHDNNNIFTIIVGKNGIGKSRLLGDVIKHCLSSYEDDKKNTFPSKVIAVSTSAFDRFPLFRNRYSGSISNDFYVYNGVRSQFGNGVFRLINNVGAGLVNNFINSLEYDKKNIARIFDFLEFKDQFSLVFRVHYHRMKYIDESLNDDNNNECTIRYGGMSEFFYTREEAKDTLNIFQEIASYFGLRKTYHTNNDSRFIIDFNNSKKTCTNEGENVDDYIIGIVLKLVNYNVISVSDVNILKKDIGSLSLKRASSGEQCIFSTLFAIAGSIKDHALIVIDEPEISLHPEWQEKYIEILSDVFSHYKNCQFIIASHSPQIVSRLKSKDSYVLSLHMNKLFNASYFSKKSSDFLLAELFDSPGYRNEYVTRIALNIFAKVKVKKRFDHDDKITIEKLKEFKKFVNKEDPVFELIVSLEEMYEFYC